MRYNSLRLLYIHVRCLYWSYKTCCTLSPFLGLLTIRYFRQSAVLCHTAEAFATLLSWMCLKPNKTELWICKAHTPIWPSIPFPFHHPYNNAWLFRWWLCQFVNHTHTHTDSKHEHFPIDLYLCVVHARIRSVNYGWSRLIERLFIMPFLTLHVATGWGARWAYAVAWWEIIWIIIAFPDAVRRHSS